MCLSTNTDFGGDRCGWLLHKYPSLWNEIMILNLEFNFSILASKMLKPQRKPMHVNMLKYKTSLLKFIETFWSQEIVRYMYVNKSTVKSCQYTNPVKTWFIDQRLQYWVYQTYLTTKQSQWQLYLQLRPLVLKELHRGDQLQWTVLMWDGFIRLLWWQTISFSWVIWRRI